MPGELPRCEIRGDAEAAYFAEWMRQNENYVPSKEAVKAYHAHLIDIYGTPENVEKVLGVKVDVQ